MQTQPKQITIKVERSFFMNGKAVKKGATLTLDRAFAAELIANGKAVAHDGTKEAESKTNTDPGSK